MRGPTGCRYLADKRQAAYVRDGWNLTGDAFSQDENGYFHFAARNDDMIISSGYNIAGPEVEAALLSHPDVKECAVIGVPDDERGHIVQAHVVLNDGTLPGAETVKTLQDHVKATIAPYKYPRSVKFTEALPKTQTGKISALPVASECALTFGMPHRRGTAGIPFAIALTLSFGSRKHAGSTVRSWERCTIRTTTLFRFSAYLFI